MCRAQWRFVGRREPSEAGDDVFNQRMLGSNWDVPILRCAKMTRRVRHLFAGRPEDGAHFRRWVWWVWCAVSVLVLLRPDLVVLWCRLRRGNVFNCRETRWIAREPHVRVPAVPRECVREGCWGGGQGSTRGEALFVLPRAREAVSFSLLAQRSVLCHLPVCVFSLSYLWQFLVVFVP